MADGFVRQQRGKIGPGNLLALASEFAAHAPLVYLHPSSGFFLEAFRDEPNGSIHRLVTRSAEEMAIPALTDAMVATNEHIWQLRWTHHLSALAPRIAEPHGQATRWAGPLLKWLRLENPPNETAAALGKAYSKALNYWGVQMQRHGRATEAVEWFGRAIAVNPDNLAAHINLEYAGRNQRGDRARLTVGEIRRQYPELFAKYETWWEVLNHNGPVDEPTFLLQTGGGFLGTKNYRQAADAFARCVALRPIGRRRSCGRRRVTTCNATLSPLWH